jgi:hypothetical protein
MKRLVDRTARTAECSTNEMLTSTCPETAYRLDVCSATNGAILRSAGHIRSFVMPSV